MFKKIFQLIFNLTTQPAKTWLLLAEEKKDDNKQLLSDYIYPILGLITLCSFIGSIGDGIEGALKSAICDFVSFFAGFYLASVLLKELAVRWFKPTTLVHCQFFVAYASVLVFLIGMLSALFGGFGLLYIFLPYTVYIVWEGVPSFMGIEEEQQLKFTVWTTAILMVPYILSFVINTIMLK